MTDPQVPQTDPADADTPQETAPDVQVVAVDGEPLATTAGEQDHSKPSRFRGEAADAPAATGKPAGS